MATQYKILSNYLSKELEKEVNQYLQGKDGRAWECLGGPTFTQVHQTWTQAVVSYRDYYKHE